MQVQNIQRPQLFQEFFNFELLWNNEYLTYIQAGIKNVTSNIQKIVNTSLNNIKTSLKKITDIRFSDNWFSNNLCPALEDYEEQYFFYNDSNINTFLITGDSRQQEKILYDSFSILPQPHNGASSMV